jgi:hypothetical protein
MAKWKKTSPYGDYRDPLQNHKFDDNLIFNPKTKKYQVYDSLANILHEAKWFFGKHIGGKKLKNVQYINRKSNKARAEMKKYVNKNETETNKTETNADENQ